ncbi:MAG: glycosyltransferase family 2 protein [Acidobacteriales bacterium]|nr:glycosyltransferase family 2 protein [Terriglobales bacterium]
MYTIVIPAYNEGQRLGPTLDKILSFVAKMQWDTEVIVVNDGSKDNTVEIVQAYAANYPSVRLVQNPGNRGKGYAVKHGMLSGKGRIMLMTDADLSSPIEESLKLFAAIDSGVAVAIGSRWIDPSLQTVRQSWFRQLGGRGLNILIRLILGLPFKDTQCGFKAFSREAVAKLFPLQRVDRWGFDPELLYIAKRQGLTTVEVGVHWANDERSKLHPFRDALRILEDVMRVRKYAIAGTYDRTQGDALAARPR